MWNRRHVLMTLPAFLALRPLRAAVATRQNVWIGAGASRGATSGIYHAWLDTQSGKLTEPVLAIETPSPSWLTIMRDARGRQILYSTNELERGQGGVSSFVMDNAQGTLTLLNHVLSQDDGPTYLTARPASRTLYTANYAGSGVTVFGALPDGSLTPPIQQLDMKDAKRFGTPGPDHRQVVPHPHSVVLSPDGKFAVISDLGNDVVYVFAIEHDGKLSDAGPLQVKAPPATGPRHLAFHPNGRWVYGIDELNNTLRRYGWQEHGATAALTYLGQTISTIAPGEPDPGRLVSAAEVAVTRDGRFLYATSRGDDTIMVFDIAARTGELSFKQSITSGGREPRHFGLDPSEQWIICCNGNNGAVTTYRRNKTDGTLAGPLQTLAVKGAEVSLCS